MSLYFAVKTLHIVSSAVLFGTGIGIAFFMWRCRSAVSVDECWYAARNTVLADSVFTLPAVIIQPASGAWLIWYGGYDWTAGWLLWTYVLYIVAGLCWLPVVWIQLRMKALVSDCRGSGQPLPGEYHRLFRVWVVLGWPAFSALLVIFYLMVTKPV